MKVTKVTSKGQITIPVEFRVSLGIDEDSYLEVTRLDDELRLRKLPQALGASDSIWDLIGAGDSGLDDVAEKHDAYLANGELEP